MTTFSELGDGIENLATSNEKTLCLLNLHLLSINWRDFLIVSILRTSYKLASIHKQNASVQPTPNTLEPNILLRSKDLDPKIIR